MRRQIKQSLIPALPSAETYGPSSMGKPLKGKGKKKGKPKRKAPAAVGPAHPGTTAVWRPGVDAVENGETLDYDPTAYDCLTAFSIDWPSLRWAALLPQLGWQRSDSKQRVSRACAVPVLCALPWSVTACCSLTVRAASIS